MKTLPDCQSPYALSAQGERLAGQAGCEWSGERAKVGGRAGQSYNQTAHTAQAWPEPTPCSTQTHPAQHTDSETRKTNDKRSRSTSCKMIKTCSNSTSEPIRRNPLSKMQRKQQWSKTNIGNSTDIKQNTPNRNELKHNDNHDHDTLTIQVAT